METPAGTVTGIHGEQASPVKAPLLQLPILQAARRALAFLFVGAASLPAFSARVAGGSLCRQ